MESQIKACIINVALGHWYPKGQDRLIKSLNYHGFSYDLLVWTDWPNDNYDKSCPYNCKASAFEEAIKLGYTHILWIDCSVWAIKDVMPLFDIIHDKGYYILSSGYNASQTCSDKCLEYFALTRDEAESIPDSQTTVFGVNIETQIGTEFINCFIESAKNGVFLGSREHDNQSQDSRFMFHRQDQSAATCICSILKMELTPLNTHVCYYQENMHENIILTARGL